MPATTDTVTLLENVKMSLRVKTTSYDTEITGLINAACYDLGIVGVTVDSTTTDPLLIRAIITYCRVHFGSPDDFDRLKASYDEQKAQLITATGYGMEA
jgi:hypothetical protein